MTAPASDDYFTVKLDGFSAEIFVYDERWDPLLVDSIRAVASALLPQFEEPLGAVNIRLDNNLAVASLNAQFRGKDKPTNVLSFPSDEDGDSRLGDIILAFETCRDEAKADDKQFDQHFMHLILHGLLHLLGFDHTNEVEALEMESLEREILAQLGVPDPYDDDKFEIG